MTAVPDPTSGPEPNPELAVVENQAQIRALSSPLRTQILNLLVERSATAKQVADLVGGTRGRVHYQIKQLESAGLVEIVSRVERGGVVEKYYRAVARNFWLSRGIGEHAALADDVRTAISTNMLSWRRERVLRVDPAAIARRIITDCLAVSPGGLVLVRADFVHEEIVEDVVRAIDSVDAHALVLYRGGRAPSFLTRWKRDLAAAIVFDEPVGHLAEAFARVSPEEPERRAEIRARLAAEGTRHLHASVPGDPLEDPISRELIEAGVRTIYFGYPTPQRAALLGVEFQALHDACWTALDIDYPALARAAEGVRSLLAAGREVHVRSMGGTDLRFRIDGRPIFVDDGVISQWEVDHARCWNHLPAGKLVLAPVRGSAQGSIYSARTDYLGVAIRGIRLRFEDGRVVAASADENEDLLHAVLSAGTGDHLLLGGFEVGMNPRMRDPVGYAMWDSKSYGHVTLSLGENRVIAGENASDFAWGLLVTDPRVALDGTIILEQRRFRTEGGDS